MKKALTFLPTLLISMVTFSQSIGLIEIKESSKKNGGSASINADSKGGSIVFDRTYRSGCVGVYNFKWTFSQDVTNLEKGDVFTVDMECIDCSTPCGFKWTIGSASGSEDILDPEGYQKWKYNSNIKVTKSTGEVYMWEEGNESHTTTFEVTMSKDVRNTGFFITMGSHSVYYIYEKGVSTINSGNGNLVNCHSLFGLGKLVNALEMGAYESQDWKWMDQTIGHALNHVAASNCLSDTFLKDLRKRIKGSEDTSVFLSDIQEYSLSLESEITESCSCCGSCK